MKTPRVRIEHVWHDDQLLEIRVLASNGPFAGVTEVYSTARALKQFASGIQGFPGSPSATYAFDTGDDGQGRSVDLAFSCRGSAGQVVLAFTLRNGNQHVAAELMVEPGAIDRFHTSLLALSEGTVEAAQLEGVSR